MKRVFVEADVNISSPAAVDLVTARGGGPRLALHDLLGRES
jgi:hypothetical protein